MSFTSTAWGLGTLPTETWLNEAACKPDTAELFWPVSSEAWNRETLRALAICRQCPVMDQCGQWATENRETEGIWGGMRPVELRRLSHGKPGVHTAKTHCPFGHEYTEANTYLHADGKRRCRKCKAARSRELRAELTAARPGWRKNIDKSECWRGHPFDDVNTYTDSLGRRLCRACRACRAATTARYHARKKAAMSS